MCALGQKFSGVPKVRFGRRRSRRTVCAKTYVETHQIAWNEDGRWLE